MKKGWTYKKLGEVCEIFGRIGFRGYTKGDLVNSPDEGAITLSPSNIVSGEMDFSKCSYITWAKYEESPEIMIYPGDILIVKTASVGKTALVKSLPHKATINPQFVVLKNITANNEYLSYYLKSEIAQNFIWSIAKGAAAQTVSQKNLAEMKIPIPPLSEQQRIVERLDAAFAHIDELKAKAEKQLNEVRQLFQAELTESMRPKEGWEEKKLGEVAKITHGKNQKEVISEDGQYPIYGSGGNIMGYANGYLCEAGTTILGRKGSINNPIFIEECFWNVDTAFGISAKEGNDSKYIYYFIKGIDWLKKNTGTTLPSLTQQVVGNVPMGIPPLPAQQRIVAHLDALSENVRKYEEIQRKTLAECDALKQAILREVFE